MRQNWRTSASTPLEGAVSPPFPASVPSTDLHTHPSVAPSLQYQTSALLSPSCPSSPPAQPHRQDHGFPEALPYTPLRRRRHVSSGVGVWGWIGMGGRDFSSSYSLPPQPPALCPCRHVVVRGYCAEVDMRKPYNPDFKKGPWFVARVNANLSGAQMQ